VLETGVALSRARRSLRCAAGSGQSTILRDYINATIGFEGLSEVFGKSSKSLMRMFSPKGNPQAGNLFGIISYLQDREGIHLEVKARKVA
jgi:DNA-binding phage protein